MDLKTRIAQIPEFPKPGVLFYDISPLLGDGKAWREAVRQLTERIRPYKPDLLIGIESRGFLAAAPLACELGIGFAMIRKRGKLPGSLLSHDYALEYGTDRVEIQANAVKPGQRVVVLDDLLATGGTMAASITLLRLCGAEVVATGFLIELGFLDGRSKLDVPAESLMRFD
ncbi:MAG: adenine phosphoribosyltransferase [Rhodospirillales bacterium]|nr:adenine phosphoribosyltransferase [Rhodospirillales bacterium]